ncbi:ankyrin repeat domain-containing protein, partial [Streptomyces iconiensis]
LDGTPWPRPTGKGRRYRLVSHGGFGGGFRTAVDLLLTGLPPEGPLTLVIEWPEQGVPETSTPLDAAVIRAAASQVLEIWPELTPASSPLPPEDEGEGEGKDEGEGASEVLGVGLAVFSDGVLASGAEERVDEWRDESADGSADGSVDERMVGPFARRAGPAKPGLAFEPDPHRYDPRPDWEDMPLGGWSDLALVRARLDAGADPRRPGEAEWDGRTPLHEAAEAGASAEVLAELVRRGASVDAPDDEGGTALWAAVCEGDAEGCEALLSVGADAWRPCVGEWSPGRLALTLPSLAPLFERLPGAVQLTGEEWEEQAAADRLIEVFGAVEHIEGTGVAFVAGLGEEELIRALGSTPAECPVLDLDREPGPFGTGPGGFDPGDFDESQSWVGVTGVEGGCVVIQPMGHMPGDERFLRKVSQDGGTAYGVYFNPKGGTFGNLARDGRTVRHEEIGLEPFEEDPPEFFLYRFWQRGDDAPYDAASLAYACATAGLQLTDPAPLLGPPRRWVRVPYSP